MRAIFISYRRRESSGYSGRIYDRLRAILGQGNVFMDVESIEPGKDWRSELQQRVANADVVLVLIGPEWLTLTDGQGKRRLDDPQDVTHWEIVSAVAQGKRIIPVLLAGASLPHKRDLPDPLATLADRQCVEIRHESFEAGLETLIARLTGENPRGQMLIERAKRWGIPAIVVAAALLAWLRAFDFATLDTRAATWTLAAADMIAPVPLDESIALVGIDRDHTASDPQMRARYAEVLTRLAGMRATAVVLDMHFHSARPGDEILAAAMRAARSNGVGVFFTFVETQAGKARAHEGFAAAATRVGLACVGRKLGYASTVPLAFGIRETAQGLSVDPLPTLALLGAVDAVRVDAVNASARTLNVSVNDGRSVPVEFSLLTQETPGRQGCGAILPGTRTAELMVRTSPLDLLRARRVDFDDVLAGRVAPARMSGKTVFVGYETAEETFRVAHGLRREARYGYELHADSMNTLKMRRTPRFVDLSIQALSSAALAAIGASLGVRQRKLPGWKVGLTVLVLLSLYIGIAIALAAGDDLLLYSAYDIVAFVFAYGLFRHLSKRWMP